uniref:Uncharacterized protein n=1 Tax=Parascaris univalens TaxID=6257 RepID=A0A915A6F1_PARUN
MFLLLIIVFFPSLIHLATITVLTFGCGSKKQGSTAVTQSVGLSADAGKAAGDVPKPAEVPTATAAAQQRQNKKDEIKKHAEPNEKKGGEKIDEDLKSKSNPAEPPKNKEQAKVAEGKDNPPAAAPADEDEGGYESCPDMTPEQLAKIANEPPPK